MHCTENILCSAFSLPAIAGKVVGELNDADNAARRAQRTGFLARARVRGTNGWFFHRCLVGESLFSRTQTLVDQNRQSTAICQNGTLWSCIVGNGNVHVAPLWWWRLFPMLVCVVDVATFVDVDGGCLVKFRFQFKSTVKSER